MRKRTKKRIVISDSKSPDVLISAFLDDVAEINNLIKITDLLSNYHRISPVTVTAITGLNQEICRKVKNLSTNLVEYLRIQNEKDK